MNPPSSVHIPFLAHLGIELLEESRERARITLTLRPELLNSWGVAHGGVVMTMLDTAMGVAVRGHLGVACSVVTIDLSASFMNPARGPRIDAEGRVLRGGRSTFFCECEVRDEAGTLLAKAIGTFKPLEKRA